MIIVYVVKATEDNLFDYADSGVADSETEITFS